MPSLVAAHLMHGKVGTGILPILVVAQSLRRVGRQAWGVQLVVQDGQSMAPVLAVSRDGTGSGTYLLCN